MKCITDVRQGIVWDVCRMGKAASIGHLCHNAVVRQISGGLAPATLQRTQPELVEGYAFHIRAQASDESSLQCALVVQAAL